MDDVFQTFFGTVKVVQIYYSNDFINRLESDYLEATNGIIEREVFDEQ